MGQPLPIPFPLKGLDENWGFGKQPPLTSRKVRNMRAIDPTNGRITGAQRSGTTRHVSAQVVADSPVKALVSVMYDAKNQTYASLGNSLVREWDTPTPTSTDSIGVVIDKQGNRYAIDGNTGVVKWNSAGTQLWKIGLPAPDPKQTIRALHVDDTDTVFIGTSAGGDATKARLWAYRQLDDNKTEKLWEMETGSWVETMKAKDGLLYVLLNYPDRNKAYVVVLSQTFSNLPSEDRRWEVPYPANDLDIGSKDGSIFTASDVNTTRGFNPQSPQTSTVSEDWTIKDLTNWRQRLWSWHDAKDRESLAILPRSPQSPEEDEGGEVVAWFDKSGNGRSWYAGSTGSAISTDTGPRYRKNGIGGLPAIHFNGVNQAMTSDDPPSDDRGDRESSLSTFPTYKGAQFACFAVVRFPIEAVRRTLFLLRASNGAVGANDKFVLLNRASELTTTAHTLASPPGSVCVRDPGAIASDAAAGGTVAPLPTGLDNQPLPGAASHTGLCIVTWVNDGGQHNPVGSPPAQVPSRSILRVNGQPVDRWQGDKDFRSLYGAQLGWSWFAADQIQRFAGEIIEMVVLSESYDENGDARRLLEMPQYPDVIWGAGSDTELERIEGWLAHRNGIAHELPAGQASYLRSSTNPSNLQTVDVAGTVYTWVSGAPAAANEVRIGASVSVSMANLFFAINRIGTPGTDYGLFTTQHTGLKALAPITRDDGTTWIMGIRHRNPFVTSTVALTNPPAWAATWTGATTTDKIPTAAATSNNEAHFPHPFFIEKTATTAGGPPRTEGAGIVSKFWSLRSKWGILAKWDPANGKPRWVVTSNYDGSGIGIGGVGYAVRVASNGEVFSAGPRQAIATGPPAILADAFDVRKFGDTGAAFVVTPAGVGDPWTVAPGALTYAYPRMAVDKYDNIFVPYFGAGATSLLGYKRASSAGAAIEILNYSGLPDANEAHAVAVDPNYPDYPSSFANTRPEFLTLATRLEAAPTVKSTIWNLRLISTTQATGSTRTMVHLAVGFGTVKRFAAPSTMVTVTGGDPAASGGLDTTAQFIDYAVVNGEVVFTDGRQMKVYNPKTDTLTLYKSLSPGGFLPRCKLLARWNGRLLGARSADAPQDWFMTKKGNIYNCDVFPYTITATMAVRGNDARAAICPDIITAIIVISDDLVIFGCDHSLQRMTGDPANGGSFDLISDITGAAFGRSWTKDPEGNCYFAGSRGGIFMLTPDLTLHRLSLNRVERKLSNVDFANYRLELIWNTDDDGLHVFQFPMGAGGTQVSNWFWERKTDFWSEDYFGRVGATSIQPTAGYVSDGDASDDRRLVLGTENGRLLRWDRTARGDDVVSGAASEAIDSEVLIGPLAPEDEWQEYLFTDLEATFAPDQGAPYFQFYASEVPDTTGPVQEQGRFDPGKNETRLFRARGGFVFLSLRQADRNARWAYGSMQMRAEPMGRKKAYA